MEKVVYKVGTFTDFAGFEREVVLCAVSQECNVNIGNPPSTIYTYSIGAGNSKSISWNTKLVDDRPVAQKVLRLGISVQNPADKKSNSELGKTIALGKAKKDKSCFGKIYSTNSGFINQKMVEALLDQEFEYFKNSPHVYIKGYKKDKELFEKNPRAYYNKYNLDKIVFTKL